jgi:hypothetical protein
MTHFKILLPLLCCAIINLFAQSSDSTSLNPLTNHVVYSSPATILPYFSIGLGASAMPYGTVTPEYRGYVFINIQDVGELSVNNEDFLSDYHGLFIKSPLMSKIKLKLFSETQKIPAISFSYQTMLSWENILDMNLADRPDLVAQGLEELQYNYSIYTATITVSKEFTHGFIASLGCGIKNIQCKGIVMFTATSIAWNWNRYDNPGITKNIIPYGYLNGQYELNNRWTILGEIQNYPTLSPNITNKNIQINESYLMALGGRLSFSKGMCLNIIARNIVPYNSANGFDIIAGLSFALPSQALKLTE